MSDEPVAPEVKGSFADYDVSAVRGDPAAVAIKGMPASTLADTLNALERQRAEWTKDVESGFVDDEALVLRKEVAVLALAYGKLQNAQSAATNREDFYQQFLKLTADLRDFRRFLMEHFQADLFRAEELNTPLLVVAKMIMLDSKLKKRRWWQW